MKFYYDEDAVTITDGDPLDGSLTKLGVKPYTNSKQGDEISILISKAVAIKTVENGGKYSLGKVAGGNTCILYPLRVEDKDDPRILVMGVIDSPGHRQDGRVDSELSTVSPIYESCGGGAFGSGACFVAILSPGDRIVSREMEVWENDNMSGTLVKRKFHSMSEYNLFYGVADIEWI